jgi:hypothetical protein
MEGGILYGNAGPSEIVKGVRGDIKISDDVKRKLAFEERKIQYMRDDLNEFESIKYPQIDELDILEKELEGKSMMS